MSLVALAVLVLQVPPYVLDGRCEYPADLTKADPLATLYDCRRVEIDEGEVVFLRGADAPAITFRGDRRADRLAVTQIVLRDGTTRPASGECRHHRPDRPTSSVLCTAVVHGRIHIANLIRRSTQAR